MAKGEGFCKEKALHRHLIGVMGGATDIAYNVFIGNKCNGSTKFLGSRAGVDLSNLHPQPI